MQKPTSTLPYPWENEMRWFAEHLEVHVVGVKYVITLLYFYKLNILVKNISKGKKKEKNQ